MSEVAEPKQESVERDEKSEDATVDSVEPKNDEKEKSVEHDKPKNDGKEKSVKHDKPKNDGKEKSVKHDEVQSDDKVENPTQDDSIVDSSINLGEKSEADIADDEESDSDESLPPGLLERPVQILDQKRERKKITRFSYDDEKPNTSTERKNTVEIPKGIGIPLKEHPRVEYQLQRNTAEDLKVIHRFLYGSPGINHLVKKNIREFSGFVLDRDSPQYERKEDTLGRFTVDNLKWALTVLDVQAKGKKEDLMDALMEWSMCPKPQDNPVPGKKGKPTSTDTGKKKIKVKRSVKRMENGDTTSDAATPSKKSKKNQKKPKKATEKSAKIKITSPKSKPKIDDGDSSEDEPLVKKKSPPSNGDIKKFVEALLKDADLEVLTMKVVFQKVYEKYPDFDLTDRKSYIKETVKKIIS